MAELACSLDPVTSAPGVAVAVLRGMIDPRNVESLGAAFSRAVAKGFRTIVVDLRDIRYITSSGLSFLVNLSDYLGSRGGSLHLANAQPKVKVVFELMAVDQFFRLHPTVDAALAAIAPTVRPARPRPRPVSSGRRDP